VDASVDTAAEKQLVAEHAAELVGDGMAVGLGTGSTVNPMLHALAARKLKIRCVTTSRETEQLARELGLPLEPFDHLDRLDLAIDGADQVAPDGWLVKGGGGAHTREKIVAAAADRFVVIVDSTKPVERIRPPIPLELAEFGLNSTLRELGAAQLRDAARSPDNGVIADYVGEVNEPERIADWLAGVPGVIEHGLFGPGLVSEVLVARGQAVETLYAAGT
jgi:ribose 5-phosphate isomerase A